MNATYDQAMKGKQTIGGAVETLRAKGWSSGYAWARLPYLTETIHPKPSGSVPR
jgi:hypothetical protein